MKARAANASGIQRSAGMPCDGVFFGAAALGFGADFFAIQISLSESGERYAATGTSLEIRSDELMQTNQCPPYLWAAKPGASAS